MQKRHSSNIFRNQVRHSAIQWTSIQCEIFFLHGYTLQQTVYARFLLNNINFGQHVVNLLHFLTKISCMVACI